jgi:tellurite resistance protein
MTREVRSVDIVDKIRRWMLEDRSLSDLDDETCRDILEGMYMVMHADGAVRAEESLRLRREALRLPWAWEQTRARLDDEMTAASTRARTALADPDGYKWRVRAIAERVLAAGPRDSVYRMLAGVAASDGVDAAETTLLDEFRRALGLTHARAGDIEEGVQDELFGSAI